MVTQVTAHAPMSGTFALHHFKAIDMSHPVCLIGTGSSSIMYMAEISDEEPPCQAPGNAPTTGFQVTVTNVALTSDTVTLVLSGPSGISGPLVLVLVDLSKGIKDAGVRTIDLEPSEFVDLSQCRQSFSHSDFESLSQEPTGLIQIQEIESLKPGWACLQFVPNACLKYSVRMLQLP